MAHRKYASWFWLGLLTLALPRSAFSAKKFECPQDGPTRESWVKQWPSAAAVFSQGMKERAAFATCCEAEATVALFKDDKELRECFAPHCRLAKAAASLLLEMRKKPKAPPGAEDWKKYNQEAARFANVPDDLNDQKILSALDSGNLETADVQLEKLNEQRAKDGKPKYTFAGFSGLAEPIDGKEGYGRYMIYDPGSGVPRVERWINFTVPVKPVTDGKVSGFKQLSIVATVTDKDGMRKGYFADKQRVHDAKESAFRIQHSDVAKELGDCLTCHTSGGPLGLRGEPLAARYAKPLADINEGIAKLPIVESPKPMDSMRERPAPLEKGEFSDGAIRDCFDEDSKKVVTKASIKRVSAAMNCTKCHDDVVHGKLNYSYKSMFGDWVLKGHMPPKTELDKTEREALHRCVVKWIDGKLDEDLLRYDTACSLIDQDALGNGGALPLTH